MKWIFLTLSALFQISFIWFMDFMHSSEAIISFLCILLFLGWVIKESKEDMAARSNSIIRGIVIGTYVSAAVISFLAYQHYLPLHPWLQSFN